MDFITVRLKIHKKEKEKNNLNRMQHYLQPIKMLLSLAMDIRSLL
jgi:hypothetical protein